MTADTTNVDPPSNHGPPCVGGVKCVPYFVRRYKNNNHLKIEVILAKRKRVNVSCEKKKSECQSGHLLNVSRPLCMKIQLCQDSILNLALSRLTCTSFKLGHQRENIYAGDRVT